MHLLKHIISPTIQRKTPIKPTTNTENKFYKTHFH